MSDLGALRIDGHPLLGERDNRQLVEIDFDGRRLAAFAGESIATCLHVHGVRQFRQTPEHDRPRGYFCGTGRCSDCVVIVDGVLNVQACTTPVQEGMTVSRQSGLGEWAGSE